MRGCRRLTCLVATEALALLAAAGIGVTAASAQAAGVTWFMAGSSNELPSCSSCEVSLPASGSDGFGSLNNSSNELLSPGVAIVASDLSVEVDTAPGSGATRTFALFFRADASRSLRCDIVGPATTCSSGAQTITVPPRSRLVVDALNLGNAPATRARLSWRAATP